MGFQQLSTSVLAVFRRHPWLNWLVVISFPMIFFLIDRLVALSEILDIYAARTERTAKNKSAGVFLGMLEDLVVTFTLVAVLVLVDLARRLMSNYTVEHISDERLSRTMTIFGRFVCFLVALTLVALAIAPFAADMMLMRSRQIRFTTDLLVTYAREKNQAGALEIDPREIRLARATISGAGLFAIVYALLFVFVLDLTHWWPSKRVEMGTDESPLTTPTGVSASFMEHKTPFAADIEAGTPVPLKPKTPLKPKSEIGTPVPLEPKTPATNELDGAGTPKAKPPVTIDLESGAAVPSKEVDSKASQDDSSVNAMSKTDEDVTNGSVGAAEEAPKRKRPVCNAWFRIAVVTAALITAYILLIDLTRAISQASSPLVTSIALNASLNEFMRNYFGFEFQPKPVSGDDASAEIYLNAKTESYKLLREDVIYRQTLDFKGPLAFDVKVDEKDPPNVLVLAVESFRYFDSLFLAGNTSAGAIKKQLDLSLTPNFDKWAQKGIAFSNMWSSWQTSRSLEAILFGQIAYDSVTDSGTTTGRTTTKLSGMPQFFQQKGYETLFTTGCTLEYDQWDSFLPSHGFQTVLGAPQFKEIAERDYNISKDDWDGPAHRGFWWGVHDDLSFDILGDIMTEKIKNQTARVARGEDKKPFFHNHYTISSHTHWDSTPTWFENVTLPDFSPLCEGWKDQCELIKQYSKLRYFTDMELGKFLDRMDAAGVLKDTIVVIVGDHGQAPELGLTAPQDYQTAVTHVAGALIAQGRLGDHVGMVIDDATHHYDLLNTLMDIVGVPPEGFYQTGVGRSLKRQIPFGERIVWSNNPMKKMSAVRGHERYVYDRSSNDVGLFDTIKDPLEKNDLLPSRPSEEVAEWTSRRTAGRKLSAYFKSRWDGKCLTQLDC